MNPEAPPTDRTRPNRTPPSDGPSSRVIEVETVYSNTSDPPSSTPDPPTRPPQPQNPTPAQRTPEELFSPIPPSLRRQAQQLEDIFDQDPNWAYDPLPSELESILQRMNFREQDLSLARSYGFTNIAAFIRHHELSIPDICDKYPKRDLLNPIFQNLLVNATILGGYFTDVQYALSRRDNVPSDILLPENFSNTNEFIREHVNFRSLREHYRACVHPTRKSYLDYIEEFCTESSLVGSRIGSSRRSSSTSRYSSTTGRTRGIPQGFWAQ